MYAWASVGLLKRLVHNKPSSRCTVVSRKLTAVVLTSAVNFMDGWHEFRYSMNRSSSSRPWVHMVKISSNISPPYQWFVAVGLHKLSFELIHENDCEVRGGPGTHGRASSLKVVFTRKLKIVHGEYVAKQLEQGFVARARRIWSMRFKCASDCFYTLIIGYVGVETGDI